MALRHNAQQHFTSRLFENYLQSDFQISTNAPACVEITVLRSTINNRLLICLTNFQDELPNIAINDLKATISLPADLAVSKSVDDVGNVEVDIRGNGQILDITISQLETMAILELELSK